eukprot:1280439-Ditylum_brightwellii.AAC.1
MESSTVYCALVYWQKYNYLYNLPGSQYKAVSGSYIECMYYSTRGSVPAFGVTAMRVSPFDSHLWELVESKSDSELHTYNSELYHTRT